MSQLILASSSIYRRTLLTNTGFEFEYQSPNVDESALENETPIDLVQRLAKTKAESVATHYSPDDYILGMDQVLVFKSQAYGKPRDKADAISTLMSLRNNQAQLCCAVAITHNGISEVELSISILEFGQYTEAEVERYVELEQPYDCAAGLKTEKRGALLLNKIISDDPNSIIGIPILKIHQMLRRSGFAPMPLDEQV